MQTNVATPTKPTILEVWDLQEGCHSNTLQDEDRIRIYGERKYYGVCKASLDYAKNHKKDSFRIGIRQRGDLRWLGFAWAGTRQPIEWLAEIAEYLVENAHNDFEGMEDIEVEIKWPEKFIETIEYKPAGMSARELIEEAGIDWGIFHLRLSEDRCSVLVTLNQWEQSDPPTSFGTLEVKIAEKTAFRIGKLLVKKGEDPAIAKTLFVRQAIVDKARGRLGISGDIECPVCGTGKVFYWIGFNGQIHAECSTPYCVHWME